MLAQQKSPRALGFGSGGSYQASSEGGRKKRSSNDGFRLHCPPQNSAEPLGVCRRVLWKVCMVEDLLQNPHTEPYRFCRTLGAKPSFSDPASSSPRRQAKRFSVPVGFIMARSGWPKEIMLFAPNNIKIIQREREALPAVLR